MRADFYILTTQSRQKRIDMICKITEKAYNQQQTVLIHTDDIGLANEIDERLWTFKEESFIPHSLKQDNTIPIWIGAHQAERDILINISETVPSYHQLFSRIIEVAHEDNELKDKLREHYAFYKKQGFDLHTHQLAG